MTPCGRQADKRGRASVVESFPATAATLGARCVLGTCMAAVFTATCRGRVDDGLRQRAQSCMCWSLSCCSRCRAADWLWVCASGIVRPGDALVAINFTDVSTAFFDEVQRALRWVWRFCVCTHHVSFLSQCGDCSRLLCATTSNDISLAHVLSCRGMRRGLAGRVQLVFRAPELH